MAEELKHLDLQAANYQETYLGRVGGPQGPEIIVTCYEIEGKSLNLALSFSDAKQSIYDILRTLRFSDPTAEELFQAFKSIFERKVSDENI